jgi:hypothetical protein
MVGLQGQMQAPCNRHNSKPMRVIVFWRPALILAEKAAFLGSGRCIFYFMHADGPHGPPAAAAGAAPARRSGRGGAGKLAVVWLVGKGVCKGRGAGKLAVVWLVGKGVCKDMPLGVGLWWCCGQPR